MKWTKEMIDLLVELYPKQGRDLCAKSMGLTSGQVRSKASRMSLKSAGISEIWQKKQTDHAKKLLGRLRPEQADVLRKTHADGKLKKNKDQRAKIGVRIKEWIEKNGHPRGTLGMKHTPESLKKISESSIRYAATRTDEMNSSRILKAMKTKVANGTYAPLRQKTTWKSAWREIGGVRKFYRSKWEANYAFYLEWLKTGGYIADWKHEPKCFWFEGVKRGTVSYLPDFWVVENNGDQAFHEVKGWMDDKSKTKIKRMAKYYPNVKLIVIDSKSYAALKKSVSSLVPGWET